MARKKKAARAETNIEGGRRLRIEEVRAVRDQAAKVLETIERHNEWCAKAQPQDWHSTYRAIPLEAFALAEQVGHYFEPFGPNNPPLEPIIVSPAEWSVAMWMTGSAARALCDEIFGEKGVRMWKGKLSFPTATSLTRGELTSVTLIRSAAEALGTAISAETPASRSRGIPSAIPRPQWDNEKDEFVYNGIVRPKPFVGSRLQIAIYKALEGRALTKQALANEVLGGEGTRLYKKNGIKEMIEEGFVVQKDGVGYYRPDAPPPELTISAAEPKRN
jgi:hypothetical protein